MRCFCITFYSYADRNEVILGEFAVSNMDLNLQEGIKEENYDYYAFISYKHEDEKWAKWVQNKLETYKLPSVLQKENKSLPKRVFPVFRDKTDITSGPLKKTLSKELEASKYLIVICSPLSSKSPYVNYEVEQFIQMGREDRIIPFIIEGEVGAKDPEKECYVPALQSKEETILGVDLDKTGKRKAFFIILARMLDIRLDTLLHRDKQRRKKLNLMLSMITAIVIVMSFFAWDYFVPKTNYYSDYVLKWGMPKGIFRLEKGFLFFGKNELKGKEDYYIITESKYAKTIKISHVNSANVPIDYYFDTEEEDRPVIAKYEYKLQDGEKHAVSATYMDRYEKVLLVLKYSDDSTIVDFTSSDGANTPITLSSDLFSDNGQLDVTNLETKSSITRYIYEYDEKGYIKSIKFMRDNRSTTPTPDKNGITGYTCEVDTYGRIISKELDYNFQTMTGSKVFKKIEYIYDNYSANLMSVIYTDDDGNYMLNNDNYAKKEFLYEPNGNLSDIFYYNQFSQRCLYAKGYSNVHIEYDKNGFHKEQTYYDESINPIIAEFGYAKEKCKYDKKGNVTEFTVFNEDGKPIVAMPEDTGTYISGFSMIRFDYDKKNRIVKQSYFDENEKPMLCTQGYAELKVTYDEFGQAKEISYFDQTGKPTACSDGFQKFVRKYTNDGLITEWRYCDSDGNLVDTSWGYSCIVVSYDENRNVNKVSFYDKDNQPALGNDKYAQEEEIWDDRGLLTSDSYFDEAGQLINNSMGYARKENEYNDNGICTKEAFYDENEKAVVPELFGYAKYEAEYDEYGNCIRTAYYDADNRLMNNELNGYAEYDAVYDAAGRVTEEIYYDQNGNLIIPVNFEWARHIGSYNEDGYPISESYFDTNNKLTINQQYGYAKTVATYDSRNNLCEQSFYDANDALFVSPVYGYATTKSEYKGIYLIKDSYYNEKGELVINPQKNYAMLIQKWDDNGNLLGASTYDEQEKPVINLYQYATVTYTYNKSGQKTEEEYFDAYGNPTIALNCGYSRKVDEYDKNDKWKKATYFDANGGIIDYDAIASETFVFCGEVAAQSAGSLAGVKLNDIVLKFCDWDYYNTTDIEQSLTLFKNEIKENTDGSKDMTVYRTTDSAIHTFSFGPGKIGVRFVDVVFMFPDDNARKQYASEIEKRYKE